MRIVVIGAGIAGLAAAVGACDAGADVVVVEAENRVGGKLRTSTFAGVAGVDEGADAYLTRVPEGVAFASRVGIGHLRNPTGAHAAIWHNGLHRLPDGLVLGVPGSPWRLARSSLVSMRGKVRAVADLALPRMSTDHDSMGRLTRSRLGGEVHDRLIDSLVGSIYATDTDNMSLAAVPQIAALARGRSLILAGRRRRRSIPATDEPLFAAPADGMESLAAAAAEAVTASGGTIVLGETVEAVEPCASGWRVVTSGAGSNTFDAAIVALPAHRAGSLFEASGWADAATGASAIETADVILVRLRIPADRWPERLAGLSGYLVPKPDQRRLTAASFGSQKWAEWQPANGDQIMRASLGRDGLTTDDLDDADAVAECTAEIRRHLDIEFEPTDFSVHRWRRGFPQYRPHHAQRIAAIEAALPPTIRIAGSSYHGIGVPACIASGARAAYALKQIAADGGEPAPNSP